METHGSDHIPTYLKMQGIYNTYSSTTIRRIDWAVFKTRLKEACQKCLSCRIQQAFKESDHCHTACKPLHSYSDHTTERIIDQLATEESLLTANSS
uniref:Tick transposon n=1 Tax=Rhipicephalus appendiculatus TaxID=34631 RepID=A0A131Z498_RHIAP